VTIEAEGSVSSNDGPFDNVTPPADLFIKRPTELRDWFSYVLLCAPDDYPAEDGYNNASAFAEAFAALAFFRTHTRSDAGREKVDEVIRSLHVAYEEFEHGDDVSASRVLEDTIKLFQRARPSIAVSDE